MINNKIYSTFPFLFLATLIFFSCEEIIDPTLQNAKPVLVVDAWINDKVEDQIIKLTWSQPYLENELPEGVSGAIISVTYDGGDITFTEDVAEAGVYRWTPTDVTSSEAFGEIGRSYTLSINIAGETFEATSKINRTVSIDSITFEEDDSPFYPDGSYTAEFWAKDPVGSGDTYWIRTYKNGTLLAKPSEINLAYDAGFSEGGNFDGTTFIPPIRSINPNDLDEDNNSLSPYVQGDSVFVEIHSITKESFTFLNQVIIQTDRPGGFAELFSTPLANVSSNIIDNPSNSTHARGFFNVAAVKGLGKKLE
jgi:hypothetical protein